MNKEDIVSGAAGAGLQLNFQARKVFLVLGAAGDKPVHVTLTLNGDPVADMAGNDAPDGKLKLDHNTLYEMIDQKSAKNG